MPRGRPKKSKRGNKTDKIVDPKLSKVQRRRELDKLSHHQKNTQETSSEDEEFKDDGAISTEEENFEDKGSMNTEEKKERKRCLEKDRYYNKKEEKRQEDITDKRRSARNVQWKNAREEEAIKDKKKMEKQSRRDDESKAESSQTWPSLRTRQRAQAELRGILPKSFPSQLELLAMSVGKFPKCRVTSSQPHLSCRDGKSVIYRQLKVVHEWLAACTFSDQIILHWACDLAVTDYNDFKARGLSFCEEKDIPLTVLTKEKAEQIRSHLWGNRKKEDVRQLTLEHAIQVYKEVSGVRGENRCLGVQELATAINSTWRFAQHVISAVKAGTEAELFKRRRRKSGVGEDLVADLQEFLRLPHVSR